MSKKIEKTTKEKRVGAIINNCDYDLKFGLENLSKYQKENNIERIHKYYITNIYDTDISFWDFLTIFEYEDIDTMLLVGFNENMGENYELIDKVEVNIESKSVILD